MKSNGIIRDPAGRNWLAFENARIQYGGIVADCTLLQMPPEALEVFKKLEDHVSKQEFRHVGPLHKQIEAFALRVCWEGEALCQPVYDVQVMGRGVSFLLQPFEPWPGSTEFGSREVKGNQ